MNIELSKTTKMLNSRLDRNKAEIKTFNKYKKKKERRKEKREEIKTKKERMPASEDRCKRVK
jgi:hypothetical protein